MTPNAGIGRILYAKPEDDVVVVKVVGRGNLELSPTLKTLCDDCNRYDYSPRYVFDLAECPTLDSTFMGTMASAGLHQTSCRKNRAIVVNPNPTTLRQLSMLGLTFLLDVRVSDPEVLTASLPESMAPPEECFSEAEAAEEQERFDKIVHMIESHEALIDAHSGNEIKFRTVLESLNESLAVDDKS